DFRRALSGPEYVLFCCLLNPRLRDDAFPVASHPPLMKGNFARRLAEFLATIGPPRSDDWLTIQDESAEKDALIQLAMKEREPFEREDLEEAVEKLSGEKEDRETRSLIENAGEKLAEDETLK